MIQLLFALLAAEAALALSLLFRTPARRLALLAIDRAKRGRGPVMARTVAATMLLVLASSGYSVAKIRRRAGELGQLTPTDQVLASRHLLEASLMGTYVENGKNKDAGPRKDAIHKQAQEQRRERAQKRKRIKSKWALHLRTQPKTRPKTHLRKTVAKGGNWGSTDP